MRPELKAEFAGPRYLMRIAELDMHPLVWLGSKIFKRGEKTDA